MSSSSPVCARMCGYDAEYLKDSCADKTRTSQKLLHWSVKDVARWVCSIELDEYVGALDTSGIHGAVMVSVCNSQELYRHIFSAFRRAIQQ